MRCVFDSPRILGLVCQKLLKEELRSCAPHEIKLHDVAAIYAFIERTGDNNQCVWRENSLASRVGISFDKII